MNDREPDRPGRGTDRRTSRGTRGRGGGRRPPRRDGRRRGGGPPDILYHATSQARVDLAVHRGVVEVQGGRPVFLSRHEGQAWHVAHRQGGAPAVLVIDVSRARRAGCRFERNRQGLWQVSSLPIRHVLNLRAGYAEQVSAGGIPIFWGPNGPELALIRVKRRNGSTWEVAKGKLEPGETPHGAAIREVREEMGFEAPLRVEQDLGYVRYGFTTPDGSPRLKTLHMYLMVAGERQEDFVPADKEGVQEVDWFTPERAVRKVPHRSLQPLMWRVRRILLERVAAQSAGEEE